MRKSEIKIGSVYAAKVSGKLVPVRITGDSPYGGWNGRSLSTDREVRIRSAAKLRVELEKNPATGKWHPVKTKPTPNEILEKALARTPEQQNAQLLAHIAPSAKEEQ